MKIQHYGIHQSTSEGKTSRKRNTQNSAHLTSGHIVEEIEGAREKTRDQTKLISIRAEVRLCYKQIASKGRNYGFRFLNSVNAVSMKEKSQILCQM